MEAGSRLSRFLGVMITPGSLHEMSDARQMLQCGLNRLQHGSFLLLERSSFRLKCLSELKISRAPASSGILSPTSRRRLVAVAVLGNMNLIDFLQRVGSRFIRHRCFPWSYARTLFRSRSDGLFQLLRRPEVIEIRRLARERLPSSRADKYARPLSAGASTCQMASDVPCRWPSRRKRAGNRRHRTS